MVLRLLVLGMVVLELVVCVFRVWSVGCWVGVVV